ncbi:unnamed protein product [Eruca vesicaria subsp. sativa]|uniref:Uncharacterized protein n=1 Tax=Eruca vesicaria subsp. sativa TaxID=29727 RepID=A0ABC8M9W2_ERUVS|nr:unnamed protein product [Eruca vesicaria subsp. sativa]
MAEVVHSVADFPNTALLAYGLSSSRRAPDTPHPCFTYRCYSICQKGAAQEGMTIRDYIWRGHDPTSVAVMTKGGTAMAVLAIAAASLVVFKMTGNAIYDPIGLLLETYLECAPSSFSCGFVFEVVYSKLSKHVVGEEVVTALGSEVIRLEKQIRDLVPGIQHVDIEAQNPKDQSL